MRYFLDTYALVEIIKGNVSYNKILDEELDTCIFNLYELYYILLRDYNEAEAEKYFLRFHKILSNFEKEDLFLASKFKLKNKKIGFSYADCLGYAIARRLGAIFLTGDRAFENYSNAKILR